MKLREAFKWLDDALRPTRVGGREYRRPIDKTDALAESGGNFSRGDESLSGASPPTAPTNWVPSQQDERPTH
jgi:hypothetical protein